MALAPDELVPRHLSSVIAERMTWSPVVVVSGARTCGKSTLLAQCAAQHDVSVIDLDDTTMRRLVEQDVTGYFSRLPRPVCIDEFQHNLEVLDVIKAELNQGAEAGRYLLTGSTRYTTLPKASQSLTGRAHLMTLWPLSQGELRGHRETFLDSLLNDPAELVTSGDAIAGRKDYEAAVLHGGYPMVHLLPSDNARRRWFRDLLELVVKRDLLSLREVRRRDVLVDLVAGLSGQTAQVLNMATLADRLDVSASLVAELTALLEAVYLVHRLPAFGRTISTRVGRSPKIHVVDTGLGAHLLGVTNRKLNSMQPAALTEFGHLVETFTVNELIKQAGWAEEPVEFAHFRTRDGQEVDLVVQADDGRVAAVEVKAGSKVTDRDFDGMRMLKEHLGEEFIGGAVLNMGRLSYRYEPDLFVLPIETLWTRG